MICYRNVALRFEAKQHLQDFSRTITEFQKVSILQNINIEIDFTFHFVVITGDFEWNIQLHGQMCNLLTLILDEVSIIHSYG